MEMATSRTVPGTDELVRRGLKFSQLRLMVALRRDGGTPAHPGATADPDAEDTPAEPAPGGDPVSGRARPVDDRPWPPPPTGSPSTPQHPDRHDQARQEDH